MSRERAQQSGTARLIRRNDTVLFYLFLDFNVFALRATGNLVMRDAVTMGGGHTCSRTDASPHLLCSVQCRVAH